MTTVIGFLGGKTGTGTTSFVYHLAWLYAEQGYRVLAVDLDPQPNLTVRMVDEERLLKLWARSAGTITNTFVEGVDVNAELAPVREPLASNLELLVGDPVLTWAEEYLADSWERCHKGDESAFHWTLLFQRIIHGAARAAQADIVLVDLAPTSSAINRAALLACQYMVTLVASDLLSSHGLYALVPRIEGWRTEWQGLREVNRGGSEMPEALAKAVGYVLREQPTRLDHSAVDWSRGVPFAYAQMFHREESFDRAEDAARLGTLKWYSSVLPMAEEARKPIFHLKPADGALGAHAAMVREARKNFEDIADRIARATWLSGAPGAQPVP